MNYKAVVLNLDTRSDRLAEVSRELRVQGIPFERFSGVRHPIGWIGFNQSVMGIFQKYRDVENLFVFEDDCYFEANFDPSVLGDLPADYDGLWLGANLQSEHNKHHSERLTILENAWTTHAVLYSKQFREWCISNWNGHLVFDEWLRVNAMPIRKCFVLRPMIAFQRPDKSDISGEYADYSQSWQKSKSRLL